MWNYSLRLPHFRNTKTIFSTYHITKDYIFEPLLECTKQKEVKYISASLTGCYSTVIHPYRTVSLFQVMGKVLGNLKLYCRCRFFTQVIRLSIPLMFSCKNHFRLEQQEHIHRLTSPFSRIKGWTYDKVEKEFRFRAYLFINTYPLFQLLKEVIVRTIARFGSFLSKNWALF